MAPSLSWIKTSLAAAAFGMLSLSPVTAAEFSVKRGLNLDIWVTWPMEDQWGDPGALLPFPEWRRTVGPERLEQLKAGGFDFVRMPVDPAPFLSPRSAQFRERLYGDVLEAVRLLNDKGLKVIVDLHSIDRSDNPSIGMSGIMESTAMFESYLDVVRRMARTLAGKDPSLVALELMNEPATVCDMPGQMGWSDKLGRLHAAARSSAARLTLVLTGGCGGNAKGLTRVDPRTIADDNVIWTFHSYQPFLLTHQGAMWAGDFIRYVTGLTYPLDGSTDAVRNLIRQRISDEAPMLRRAGMLDYFDEQLAEIATPEKLDAAMRAPFDQVAMWATANSIPPERILLGEFGMIRQEYGNPFVMPAASRAAYVGDMIAIAEQHRFPWAIWGYGGAFGVVEAFDGQPAEPDVLDVVRALKP